MNTHKITSYMYSIAKRTILSNGPFCYIRRREDD
jgi:hypothetical protein